MQEARAYGTVVYSDKRYLAVKEQTGLCAADFFPLFPEADLILWRDRNIPLPQLELVRREIGGQPVCPRETVLAYVTDWTDEGGRPCLRGEEVPVFGFDELERVAAFAVDFMDGEARREAGIMTCSEAIRQSAVLGSASASRPGGAGRLWLPEKVWEGRAHFPGQGRRPPALYFLVEGMASLQDQFPGREEGDLRLRAGEPAERGDVPEPSSLSELRGQGEFPGVHDS